MTPVDGRAPSRHEFPTVIGWVEGLRIWFRKKWGFESPSSHSSGNVRVFGLSGRPVPTHHDPVGRYLGAYDHEPRQEEG